MLTPRECGSGNIRAYRSNTGDEEPGRRRQMKNTQLCELATRISRMRRITFADVRRLQRDLLPDGISSREEAELLLAIEGHAITRDPAWTPFLTHAIVEFVVWAERPTGVVDEDTANWLASALQRHGSASKGSSATSIARGIAEEAQAFENDALSALLDVTRTRRRSNTGRVAYLRAGELAA
jgi:hypothetical protein